MNNNDNNLEKSINQSKAIPVNQKVKDSLFKMIYQKEERLISLAQFLLNIDVKDIDVKTIKPVVYGSKENDLSFMCNQIIYIMVEAQSSSCTNIPFRVLEYSVTGLRELIVSANSLYGSSRVYMPIPKFFAIQVGLENDSSNLSNTILKDYRLSDSYMTDNTESDVEPDLELIVHVFDLRMSSNEVLKYIEDNIIPERFTSLDETVLKYALTSNSITYMMRIEKGQITFRKPQNISTVAELCELLKARDIFVEIFSDREASNMIATQFSRDEMIRYDGWERGQEDGLKKGLQDGLQQGLQKGLQQGLDIATQNFTINMYKNNFTLEQISQAAGISIEEVKKIISSN